MAEDYYTAYPDKKGSLSCWALSVGSRERYNYDHWASILV